MKTSAAVVCCFASAATLLAQPDPGPRTGPTLSGKPLPAISAAEMQSFLDGKNTFVQVYDVSRGLGPRFNLDSCGGCHSQPAIGGASPAINPQTKLHAFREIQIENKKLIGVNQRSSAAEIRFYKPVPGLVRWI